MTQHDTLKRELIEFMRGLTIIDTHEHLMAEIDHLATEFTFYDLLVPYVQFDLMSAGMPKEWLWRRPADDKEAQEYWKTIGPLWREVRGGAYARVLRRALKEFWDFDDLTDANWRDVGRAMNETNTPGLYERILVKRCGIRWYLNQNQPNVYTDPKYAFERRHAKGYAPLVSWAAPETVRAFINERSGDATLEDYVEHVLEAVAEARRKGAVLTKFCGSFAFYKPHNHEAAQAEWEQFRRDPEFADLADIRPWLAISIKSTKSIITKTKKLIIKACLKTPNTAISYASYR